MTANSPYRRTTRRLISIKKHAVACLAVLCCVPVAALATTQFLGQGRDAIAGGAAAVSAFKPKGPTYDLNSQYVLGGKELPNLFAEPERPYQAAAPAPYDTPKSEPPSQIDVLGNGGPSTNILTSTLPLAGYTSSSSSSMTIPTQATIGGKPIESIGAEPVETITPGRFLPTRPFDNGPLPKAPIAGLTRMSPFGLVPTSTPTGRAPLKAYAKPFTPKSSAKTVSLIIGGLGINARQTQRAIDELPGSVTLSFASQANNLQRWIDSARAKGHEVIIELPMEPYNFDATPDSAKYTLRADVPAGHNIRNLDYLMSRAQGYFAVTNYLGERFFESEASVVPVVKHLNAAGVGFVYEGISHKTSLFRNAAATGMPITRSQSVIDAVPNAASIQQTLKILEQSTSATAPALGVGFSYPVTLDAVIEWSKEAHERGITIAPASYVLLKQKQ